jgi:hypothetical protein
MVEVFKTDVHRKDQACWVVEQIQDALPHCCANFDLDDCDKILRVKGILGESDISRIMHVVKAAGCQAQILPDDIPRLDPQTVQSIETSFFAR